MLSTPAIIGSKAKVPDPPTGLYLSNAPGNPGYLDGGWGAVSGATQYDYRIDSGFGYGSPINNGTNISIFIGPYQDQDQACFQVQVTTVNGTSDWSSAACEIVDTGGCSPTCLPENTLITMAENYKRIADVQKGDMILNGENIPSEVEEIAMMKHNKMITISFTDGSELDCTVDHPWYAEGIGWVSYDVNWTLKYYNNIEVNKLEVGQTLIGHQNKEIESITPYTKEMDTYQIKKLSVGDTYFANGMLTKIEQ